MPKRLGAEASAEAIADMYENHNTVRIKFAYLRLIWRKHLSVKMRVG